jgi:hypothetical protein
MIEEMLRISWVHLMLHLMLPAEQYDEQYGQLQRAVREN